MAKNKKNTTKVNGEEFYTDEKGNILGKVQPSYNYETVTKPSKDAPYVGPTNTPMGNLSTNQASERAAQEVLNEAAVNPEEADKARDLKEMYEKSGVNVSSKDVHKIAQNLSKIPDGDSKFQTLDSIAAKNLGLTGKAEEFSTPGVENTKAMEDSMDKRTENEKIEREVARDNPGASESEIANTTNIKKEQKDAEELAAGKAAEKETPKPTPNSESPKQPSLEDLLFAQQYYDDYRLPKNGADYLRQLWGQGAAGKAKAIGNVIGNLLGKAGTINVAGAQGQGRDFTSDWENYVNNYQKEMADRNARIFNDNMDIVKQASTNAQARKDLVAQLELALKNAGKLDANAIRLLQIWSTATAPSSALDRGISALMTLIPEGVFK